jgi:hypothetical protein
MDDRVKQPPRFVPVVQARYRARGSAEYERALARFRDQEGEILHAYFCEREPAGLALTQGEVLRVHRVMTPLFASAASVGILWRCDELLIRAAGLLEGAAKTIAVRWVFTVEEHLFGLVDREGREPGREEVERLSAELDQIDAYCDRRAEALATRRASLGVLLGLASLAAIVFVPLLVLRNELLLAVLVAGALGAAWGALVRLNDGEAFDYETRRAELVWSGIRQPTAGVFVGLGVYALVQTGALSFGTLHVWTSASVAFGAAYAERRSRFVETVLRHGARRPLSSSAGAWRLTADRISHVRFAALVVVIAVAATASAALLGADSDHRLVLAVLAGLLAGAIELVADATVAGGEASVVFPVQPLVGAIVGVGVFAADRAYADARLSASLPRLFILAFVAALLVGRRVNLRGVVVASTDSTQRVT